MTTAPPITRDDTAIASHLDPQLQVGLVVERGDLEGVPYRLTPHVTSGNPAEFAVHHRHQPIECCLITVAPGN